MGGQDWRTTALAAPGRGPHPDRRRTVLTTIVLSFLAGVWGGNGVPHLVRGITRRRSPSALGSGPAAA